MIKSGMYLSDRYEIIDKVGSGGMADVYKARDHKLNRFVAIKILKAEYNDDKNFVKKFRGEAQSAAGLSHPNIVNIYDVGEDEGMHYIVMELIEGITLKRFIERKGKLDIREAVGIGIQIAQGMEVAHANHIIHRDIKPQNIIISKEGKVKVTDFGIAKATSSNTITSNAMGSVHYFSPEQARGGYCDEKSDIYSLGVTLYEMISGHVPFEGDNAVSIALLHIQNDAKTLREMDPTVPISVDRIVQKCMQKKPERRYLTVSDLIADLKRSILEPDVDFVVIPDMIPDNSATVALSKEDLEKIREGAAIAENTTSDDDINVDISGYEDEPDDTAYKDEDSEDSEDDELDDEEDEEETKGEKVALIVAIVSAVIFAIIIIIFVLNLTGLIGSKSSSKGKEPTPSASEIASQEPSDDANFNNPVNVPSLLGKSLEDAQKIAEEKGFTLRYEKVESAMAEGLVTNQDPAAGTTIEAGTEVNVQVSNGSGKVVIPDLKDKTPSGAKQVIADLGLSVEYETAEIADDEIEIGHIVSTDPAKDTEVVPSEISKITLYLSTGPDNKTVPVPNVLGKSEDEAKKAIEDAGLSVGTVSESYSDDYDKGLVMAQSQKADIKVTEGKKIDITVSLGAEPTATPEPTQEPTPKPTVTPTSKPSQVVGYQYTIRVTVHNYATNPFDDPAISDEEDGAALTEGNIAVQALYDKTMVYDGSIASSYNSFDDNGLSFEFKVNCEGGFDESLLKVTYTLGSTVLDFSGDGSKVEVVKTKELYN